jgi:hypothetical protein
MADPLYLSVWFPQFGEAEMMPRLECVLRQFPFSPARPGVTNVAVHPASWSEPTILERQFKPDGVKPEEAVQIAADLLHGDYAYEFEAHWDLWLPNERGEWTQEARAVQIILHGLEFEDATCEENGHIQVDFGLDAPFLFENVDLDPEAAERVRFNIAKLVAFVMAVEKNCGVSGRVLWSESESNLAQKLITRLQQTQ